MINVSEIMTDPDFAITFQIERHSGGTFERGEYTENTSIINVSGIIHHYNPKRQEYDMQGNVITGDIYVYCKQKLYLSRDKSPDESPDNKHTGTSDIAIWNGKRYKLKDVKNWSQHGYYRAVAERISPC
jgi:hypothetical protein